MSMTDYAYCNLEQGEIDKVKNLENELNQNNNDDIIVLAFRKKK